MSFRKTFLVVSIVAAAGMLVAGTPSHAASVQPYFACKTASGKQVRFVRDGNVLRYSYGKPGVAPDLNFAVPLRSVAFTGSGPAGSGTWWITREVSVVFNGTRYTGHWAYHRAEGSEEAGVTVSRGERTLAETACKSDIKVDIPETDQ